MRAFKIRIILFSLLTASLAVGCNPFTRTQRGAAIGAGAGATVGAVIGKAAGNPALGAIIGGAVGGTAGAYIGSKVDRQASEIRKAVPNAIVIRKGDGILVRFEPAILFDEDKADLRPSADSDLRKLAVTIQNNPQSRVFITGYTDSTGNTQHNLDLSLRRAQAIKNCIVSAGVDAVKVTATGKGEADPIATNNTPEGRAQNRRVEIMITANDQARQSAQNDK